MCVREAPWGRPPNMPSPVSAAGAQGALDRGGSRRSGLGGPPASPLFPSLAEDTGDSTIFFQSVFPSLAYGSEYLTHLSSEVLVRISMPEPFWRGVGWGEVVGRLWNSRDGKTVVLGTSQVLANFLIFILWSS